MKATVLSMAAACLFFFSGCSEKKPAQGEKPGPAAGNPLSAPADYLGAVGKAHKAAGNTLGTVGVEQAIKAFQAEHGRNPKDLNELVSAGVVLSLPQVPKGMKYSYDPASGAVKIVAE